MIRMIAGVFGLPVKQANGKTTIVGMSRESGAFSTDPATEARLVARGVAEYVRELPKVPVEPHSDEPPKYSTAMKVDELRTLAEKHGVELPEGATKKVIVTALDAHFDASNKGTDGEDDNDDSDNGEDGAAGDGAPTFNPADAVH